MADSPNSSSDSKETSKEAVECDGKSPYGLPLPSKLIQVLTEDDIRGREVLIVGDVHGCYDELKEMMDTNNITKENTCVVFVGDLINKGPNSVGVVEYVMENGWYSVRGNHDEVAMLEYQKAKNTQPSEKFKWVTKLQQKQADWISELPYAIHIPTQRIIVAHAGLLPGQPLDRQDPDAFLHIRCVKPEGDGWTWSKKFIEEWSLWGSVWPGPEHVFYGHDARRLLTQFPYATGLDSACVYGIELTAIYPSTRKILIVKSHQPYREKPYYNQLIAKDH